MSDSTAGTANLDLEQSLFGEEQPTNYFVASAPRAPVAWYGGKAYYAEWIISKFPRHRVYIEPFGGAANVLLRKRPSDVEVFNDLDDRIVNFFRVVRDPRSLAELERRAYLTPYSRSEFVALVDAPEPAESVDRAWWFFVRCRQAIGGLGMSKLYAASWAMSTRTRRHMPEPVSKYLSAIEGLTEVAERFRTVAIECLPAIQLIEKYDAADVFFYCDPPYVPETRHGGAASTYGKEMSFEDHEALLTTLVQCKGRVMVSGYPSDLYERMLAGWTRESCTATAHLTNSGEEREEVIWMKL
ncbi:MAG: DNA adenine methylase [Phycisphaerae bacterium]|nr:DNA adenine methylase [Phycisphaerae bacterium]